jgi:hypothetical protein
MVWTVVELFEKMLRWLRMSQPELRANVLIIALHPNGAWQTTECSHEAWHKLPSDKIGALVFSDLKHAERISQQRTL